MNFHIFILFKQLLKATFFIFFSCKISLIFICLDVFLTWVKFDSLGSYKRVGIFEISESQIGLKETFQVRPIDKSAIKMSKGEDKDWTNRRF